MSLDNWPFRNQDREILLELTPEIAHSFNLWGGKPFEVFLSDHGSEFRICWFSLPVLPRDSSLGGCPAGQTASGSEHAHEKFSFLRPTVLPGTAFFLRTVCHSVKSPHAISSALASFLPGPLPGPPRPVCAGNPCSSWSDWGLVGYSLFTSVSSDFGFLPVFGQFDG